MSHGKFFCPFDLSNFSFWTFNLLSHLLFFFCDCDFFVCVIDFPFLFLIWSLRWQRSRFLSLFIPVPILIFFLLPTSLSRAAFILLWFNFVFIFSFLLTFLYLPNVLIRLIKTIRGLSSLPVISLLVFIFLLFLFSFGPRSTSLVIFCLHLVQNESLIYKLVIKIKGEAIYNMKVWV